MKCKSDNKQPAAVWNKLLEGKFTKIEISSSITHFKQVWLSPMAHTHKIWHAFPSSKSNELGNYSPYMTNERKSNKFGTILWVSKWKHFYFLAKLFLQIGLKKMHKRLIIFIVPFNLPNTLWKMCEMALTDPSVWMNTGRTNRQHFRNVKENYSKKEQLLVHFAKKRSGVKSSVV